MKHNYEDLNYILPGIKSFPETVEKKRKKRKDTLWLFFVKIITKVKIV